MAAKKNAIEERIDRLTESWNEFAENPEARLLRWVGDEDTLRMIEVFCELQNEEASDIPDLFIRFNQPFRDPREYGWQLRESLLNQYEEIRDGIAVDNIPSDWKAPTLSQELADHDAFIQTCESMRTYYDSLMVHLVAVLTPTEISDPHAWQVWLGSLLARIRISNLRLIVFDSDSSLLLEQLARSQPQQVITVRPDLKMHDAYVDLARSIPGTGPGATFRPLFVALTNAAAVGDLAGARQAAQRALAITAQQNWPLLAAPIHMALGAAYFSAGDLSRTLQCYRDANQSVVGSSDPAAPKLNIQTRFAEAAALVAAGRHREAAEVYEAIIPLAQQQDEPIALLESCRMASWCREVTGDHQRAWQWAERALEAGAALDDEARAESTLPYVGDALLRLAEHDVNASQENQIQDRITRLLGTGWRERLTQGGAAP